MTQIWIAICVHLLLAYLKFANKMSWSMSQILRLLQLNLFDRRPLLELLEPRSGPPNRETHKLNLLYAEVCGTAMMWKRLYPESSEKEFSGVPPTNKTRSTRSGPPSQALIPTCIWRRKDNFVRPSVSSVC